VVADAVERIIRAANNDWHIVDNGSMDYVVNGIIDVVVYKLRPVGTIGRAEICITKCLTHKKAASPDIIGTHGSL
jgi:hypothetical protein